MDRDLQTLGVDHPVLGRLELEELIGEGGVSRVLQGRDGGGRVHAVKLGRRAGRAGPGWVEAFACLDAPERQSYRKELTPEIIDAALEAEGRRLAEEGESFRVSYQGIARWFDPQLGRHRPALVTGVIDGRALDEFSAADWCEEAWQIIPQLLVMVMVTPRGEEVHHRDLKARNILIDLNNQLHLIDPGVELSSTDLRRAYQQGPQRRWIEGEAVTLTTFGAYPMVPPGTPGADLQAIGWMVYEGITGQSAFAEESPAPKSYNFGCGQHGRGVPGPEMLIAQVVPPSRLNPRVTPAMESVVMSLLRAPLNHDLDLAHGKSLRDWANLCHDAATSVS